MRRLARSALLCCTSLVVLWPCLASGGDLSVSPGGHHLVFRGKPCVLVGDSGTQCVMQNAHLDYATWMEDCAEAGLNTVHIWSFVAPRQRLDGSVLEERYGYVYPGITPWARKPDGPRAADGGFQWDLRRWDEGDTTDHYWPRLRDVCRLAKEKGLILGITVFWGWPKHPGDWAYHPFNVANGGPIEDSGRMATRVQMLDCPGTEIWSEPWSDEWSPLRKNQWLWETFAIKLLDETLHFGNVFYAFMDEHSYSEGNGGDHFLQMFKKRGALWADWPKRRTAVDLVYDMPSFDGSRGRNPGAVMAFEAEPARPFILLEGGPYQGDVVSLSAWSVLMGGGHYVFHNDAEQETVHTGIMGYDPYVQGGDTGSKRRRMLGFACRFFNAHLRRLEAMVPRNDLTRDAAFCLADPGEEYVVYSPAGAARTMSLDLSQTAGVLTARYFAPWTGEWRDAGPCDGGVVREFPKPDDSDWVLLVTRK